jgi:RNA polymerase sigma-70 factor (ECF subfamily)
MSEERSFSELIQAVRSGDQEAAAELVRRYEPAIRRVVRFKLSDPRLRRVIDTVDICQGVLGSFFVRAGLGQYDLENPEQLLKLLLTMARNKVAKQVQKQRAARRDNRRVAGDSPEDRGVMSPDPTPSKRLEAKELVEECRRRLTADEWQLVEQRNQGYNWTEIAARLGGKPDALRIKLARAVKRVSSELGIDEDEDE